MAETDWTDRVLLSFVDEFKDDVAYDFSPRSTLLRACGSPIEKAFAIAFMLVAGRVYGRPLASETDLVRASSPQIFFIPQFVSGNYRVDFLIGWNIGSHRHTSLVVECDGHDFHGKTKQQAARDKARDRYLSGEFAKVIRFTGSEIYKSPCKCAVEAQELADVLFWDWYMRGQRQ